MTKKTKWKAGDVFWSLDEDTPHIRTAGIVQGNEVRIGQGLWYPRNMRPLRVYLAGPMSGYDRFNFAAFEAAAADLRSKAVEVLSPAEMDLAAGLDPGDDITPAEYAAFLARDIEKIAESDIDAIVVLPGWESSGGAKTEVAFCRALGKQVLAYPSLDPINPTPVFEIEGLEALTGTDGVGDDPAGPIAYDFDTSKAGRYTVEFDNTAKRWEQKAWDPVGAASSVGINPKDAAAQGAQRTRLDLLEPAAEKQIADALANGADKYGVRNFIKDPILARVYVAAMKRHIDAWLDGEDNAPDSGLHHLAHVGANVHVVLAAAAAGKLVDNR